MLVVLFLVSPFDGSTCLEQDSGTFFKFAISLFTAKGCGESQLESLRTPPFGTFLALLLDANTTLASENEEQQSRYRTDSYVNPFFTLNWSIFPYLVVSLDLKMDCSIRRMSAVHDERIENCNNDTRK